MVPMTFPMQNTFLALPLEGQARESFAEAQDRLLLYASLFRLQPADRPHLTIQFWRSLMAIEWDQVRNRASWIARRCAPFTMEVRGAETFTGTNGLEHVLFLTIERSDKLAVLRKLCPWPSVKPFHPHITLARMRNPNAYRVHRKKVRKLLEDVRFSIHVDRLRLYGMVGGQPQTPLEDFVFSSHHERAEGTI